MSAKLTYVVEIDQTAITAPDFPRDAAWWQQFLPLWFNDRCWYEHIDELPGDQSAITVGSDHVVRVEAQDRRHAEQMFAQLRNGAVGRHTDRPDAIRVTVAAPA